MEKLRFQCRVEKKVTNHAVFENEVPLGDDVVMVQCLSCGVMGINQREDAKLCRHKFVTDEDKAKGLCGLCGISFAEWHG